MMTETMQRVLRLIPYISPEAQQELLALVKEYNAKLARAGGGPMPSSAVDDLCKAVPDQLLRDIVKDLRSGPAAPASLIPQQGPSKPVVRGTGWQSEPKNEDRSRQFEVMDAIVEHLVGGPNSPVK